MNIVRELRLQAGMQQKDLAISAGVSRPTVSEWEHGKKDPSGDRLKKLSEIFGVDPGVILGYRPYPDHSGSAGVPRTPEAQFVSGAMDRMSPADRERALNMMKAVFPDSFAEEEMA